jgi:hypothetical protein
MSLENKIKLRNKISRLWAHRMNSKINLSKTNRSENDIEEEKEEEDLHLSSGSPSGLSKIITSQSKNRRNNKNSF